MPPELAQWIPPAVAGEAKSKVATQEIVILDH